uniref:Uncharacterized protein n=1 Tax=Zea mays TaxID=4577 RepID=A0A804RIY7_MAIZE
MPPTSRPASSPTRCFIHPSIHSSIDALIAVRVRAGAAKGKEPRLHPSIHPSMQVVFLPTGLPASSTFGIDRVNVNEWKMDVFTDDRYELTSYSGNLLLVEANQWSHATPCLETSKGKLAGHKPFVRARATDGHCKALCVCVCNWSYHRESVQPKGQL